MPSSTNILNYPFAAQWFTFSKMQVNLVFVWQSYSTSTSTGIMNQGLNIYHMCCTEQSLSCLAFRWMAKGEKVSN